MISGTEPGSVASAPLPRASTPAPTRRVSRAPNRPDSRADTGEKMNIAPPMGSSTNPDVSSDNPKP